MASANLENAALAAVVPIPSLVFFQLLLHGCDGGSADCRYAKLWEVVCDWGREHPLLLVNVLFFLNVDVLFWIIGLVQQSVWLIDPYWTIIPVLIAHFYAAHPSAQADLWRSRAVIALVWFWSIRLTHSYFRRENWAWGEREDWRFTDYRRKTGKHWWWISFFLVFASQHVFLVGITLPIYTVFSSVQPWNVWDSLATVLCFAGVTIAYFADTQLHAFVFRNKMLKDLGAPCELLLDRGLWYYSRHPNYFGEQLWWWGLSLFAWNVGQPWAVLGTVLNSGCLAYTTVLVEKRMTQDKTRAAVYLSYQKSTSVLIPWFKSGGDSSKSKSN